MKKYSDYFSCMKRLTSRAGNRLAATALFMVAGITMGFAQDYTFIEGSHHKFKVDDHLGNTYVWDVRDASFGSLDPLAYTFEEGQYDNSVIVRFNDMSRTDGEFVNLVVTESNSSCSTQRAIQILIEPNNMFLEFASTMMNECYTPGEYNASLKVGLNFKDKAAGIPIPEEYFPLTLSYTVRNITAGTDAIVGNSGNPVEMAYASDNNYFLLVSEAVGMPDQTIEYELTITSVKDKYDTEITNNTGDFRVQFRVINHLPQSGVMDMAMAYVITGIEYLGEN